MKEIQMNESMLVSKRMTTELKSRHISYSYYLLDQTLIPLNEKILAFCDPTCLSCIITFYKIGEHDRGTAIAYSIVAGVN
jgi:hypothetical protein